jgi:hypothetical protein
MAEIQISGIDKITVRRSTIIHAAGAAITFASQRNAAVPRILPDLAAAFASRRIRQNAIAARIASGLAGTKLIVGHTIEIIIIIEILAAKTAAARRTCSARINTLVRTDPIPAGRAI